MYFINNYNSKPHSDLEEFTQNKPELILFYTEWCGYSRDFLPEWEKLNSEIKKQKINIKLTKIRCEGGDANLCTDKGVNGYPTLILYKNDEEFAYDGDRVTDKVIKFIESHM